MRDAGMIWTRARRRATRFARDDACDVSDRFLGPPKMVMFLDGLVFDADDARKKTPSFLFSLGIGATVDARDALEGGLLVDL